MRDVTDDGHQVVRSCAGAGHAAEISDEALGTALYSGKEQAGWRGNLLLNMSPDQGESTGI
jgi:hypothetical protein